MKIDRSNIFEIVNKSNARPDKDYGQNFLVEPDVSSKIVNSLDINVNDKVLEIGPGLGSLTHFLCEETNDLTVVDIDERMIAFLKIIYGSNKNISIVQNDIRKHDVSKYNKVIANLPYNITTETIVFLLLKAINVKKIVLMIQLDSFPHFFDVKGKEYGPQSVLLHLLGDCQKLFQVKAGSFYPAPKCSSVVFSININPVCNHQEAEDVYNFSKSLFLNRRKTISNNLSNIIKDKELTSRLLNECGIESNKRPEEISPLEYLELYRKYKNLLKS